jgi:acylphosphatase
MSDQERALVVRVTGTVQGVGYRAWAQREARRLGIRGWVANHGAGHVDAVFVGSGDKLAELVALCRKGPFAAKVDHVDARSAERGAAEEPPPGAMLF